MENSPEYTDKEIAWIKVFDLCLELGMDIDNDDSGIKNVLDFISSLSKKNESR